MRQTLLLYVLCAVCSQAQWKQVDPPAQPNSGMPFLTSAPDGTVYLSWTDPAGDKQHALRYARWNGSVWSKPETVAQGERWFVNWADFPAIHVLPDGSMLAHWLERPAGAGTYGYGIRVAHKPTGAAGSWTTVAAMNQNDVEDYAGFLSFGGGGAAFLAPPAERSAHGHHQHGETEAHLKTLRFVRFGHDGRVAQEQQLDADVCSCCMTATVATPSGLLVAYRDHLPGEIRDISLVRYRNGQWSKPEPLHRDGWNINGCPTEGPSLASSGSTVAAAWTTRASGVPRVQFSVSLDGGEQFSPPVRADDGNPLGRPALAAVDSDQMLLVWLEKKGDEAEVRVRRLSSAGQLGRSVTIAQVGGARAAGVPKVILHGRQVLVAWRSGQVRTGWIPLGSVPAPSHKATSSTRQTN